MSWCGSDGEGDTADGFVIPLSQKKNKPEQKITTLETELFSL